MLSEHVGLIGVFERLVHGADRWDECAGRAPFVHPLVLEALGILVYNVAGVWYMDQN